ncbi:hypothetical protein BHE74_00022611 [Ensete ventricosum]|nr:hypothetical protein GW17_00021372 [Ensete ventricosum]RWW69759.1 hypothetical protein BHE74_00022611 [Ensete ventricosum]
MTDLLGAGAKGPLKAHWSDLLASAQFWIDELIAVEFARGVLHLALAKQLYGASSKELVDGPAKQSVRTRQPRRPRQHLGSMSPRPSRLSKRLGVTNPHRQSTSAPDTVPPTWYSVSRANTVLDCRARILSTEAPRIDDGSAWRRTIPSSRPRTSMTLIVSVRPPLDP